MPTPAQNGLWIVIGDIHDDTGNFAKIPELGEASGVIVSGDLTTNGGASQACKVLADIEASGLPVFAQIGNMDLPEVNDWLERTGHNLHARVRELAPDVAILGIGGSTYTPMNTPSEFSEAQYAQWLASLQDQARNYPHKVLVSHNPPKNTLCDDIGKNTHVGSEAVRQFIEECQPEICVCGHIHEGRATDKINDTVIVNPGMLAEGGYVVLRYANGRLTAEAARVPA